jgi:hypothetical protein
VVDQLVKTTNKAIMGALLVDGGFKAVGRVMPHFYRTVKAHQKSEHEAEGTYTSSKPKLETAAKEDMIDERKKREGDEDMEHII